MNEEWYMWSYRAKTYLHDKILEFHPYESEDHDHCEICWARFSKYPDDMHNGYHEISSNSWICVDCYKNLKELFGWTTKSVNNESKTGDGSVSEGTSGRLSCPPK